MSYKTSSLFARQLQSKTPRRKLMAYDPDKDQLLDSWQNSETGLNIGIYRYGDGEPKLQLGPRNYTKKDGREGKTKTGRLSIADVLWLEEVIEEVRDRMNGYFLEDV
jgi:hypothetical protein